VRRLVPIIMMLMGVVSPLYAACTAIPERPPFLQGERGSIDRPFLSPDADEMVTVLTAQNPEASSVRIAAPADVLITAVFKPAAGVKPATFYVAGNDECESVERPACFIERLFCHRVRHCATGRAAGLSVATDNGVAQLRFRLPKEHAAGPVTLAVT